MIYLAKIVEEINNAFKNALSAYPSARYFGLSNMISLKTTDGKTITIPSAFQPSSKDGLPVINDDRFSFTIFHKAINSSASSSSTNGYGDGQTKSINANTDVDLILMGFKSKIKACPINLMAALVDTIPNISFQGQKIQNNINWISSNWDYRNVFNQNFQNVGYQIGPDEFIISSRYRVEQSYLKGCLNICEC